MSNKISYKAGSLHDLKTYQVGAVEAAAHRALRQHKDSLLGEYGLTGVQWYIVGAVADAGKNGIRTTDLSVMLGTTAGFMTKNIDLLEAKGYLSRKANAKDARSTYVCFNEKKRKLLDEIEKNLRHKLRTSLYDLVSTEELQIYIKTISKFSRLG